MVVDIHAYYRIKQLENAIDADVADLWQVTNAIRKEIESREWIVEGRGSYTFDDEKYREEAGYAFDAIRDIIRDVQPPAQKRFKEVMANATTVQQKVEEARAQIAELSKKLDDRESDLKEAVRKTAEDIFAEIEDTLSMAEDFSGFITISNHVPIEAWQSLKSRYLPTQKEVR